jgi:hypothetical protein
LRYIRRMIVTPTFIGLAVYYLASRFRLPRKPLLVACGILVGWPVKFSLQVRYDGWRRARRAWGFSAITAPESRGKLLGDIDIIQELQEMESNGFLGTFMSCSADHPIHVSTFYQTLLSGEWFANQYEKAGSGTVAYVTFGDYFLTTSDPGNMKATLSTQSGNFEKGNSDRTQ